ncbi:MAG: acyl-CoA carboxylase subunit beta, partial [Actinocrinis sp.]
MSTDMGVPAVGDGLRPEAAAAVPGALPAQDGARARERIRLLADTGSFQEFGSRARHRVTAFGLDAKRPAGDGVVTGAARVAGRTVAVFAQDPGALGGSLGELHAAKIAQVLDRAERARTPVVGVLDSGGARIQEGVGSLDGYGAVFRRNVRLSGRVPQISVVLGACAGGAVYSPALTDIVIMSQRARMFLTGPAVVKAVTHEEVDAADLGGPAVHGRVSGVAHLVGADDAEALALAARVLGHLPDSCWSAPPRWPEAQARPMARVPENHRKPYDVRTVIAGVVDADSFLELQCAFAPNLVIGFARVRGRSVGVVANQPLRLAGTLDIASSE